MPNLYLRLLYNGLLCNFWLALSMWGLICLFRVLEIFWRPSTFTSIFCFTCTLEKCLFCNCARRTQLILVSNMTSLPTKRRSIKYFKSLNAHLIKMLETVNPLLDCYLKSSPFLFCLLHQKFLSRLLHIDLLLLM